MRLQNHCNVIASKNRYKMVSRIHIWESRNTFCEGKVKIWGAKDAAPFPSIVVVFRKEREE
mgnify:CR=1 FL=1